MYLFPAHRIPTQPHIATIGNFDGVHVGHQALLEKTISYAKLVNLPSLAIIFEPQPSEFFSKKKKTSPPARLTYLREKITYIKQAGIQKICVLRFNTAIANLTAQKFIQSILWETLQIKHLVIGDDFHFGYHRTGNAALLEQEGKKYGFSVEIVPAVFFNNERISSTRIRNALSASDYLLAERLLGRPYCIAGKVTYGKQLGRTLGFPTANIALNRKTPPPIKGIFAVRIHRPQQPVLLGVANLGTNPAVRGKNLLLEIHIFNFCNNLYGQLICVEFCKKLREEEDFSDLMVLQKQMQIDVEKAQAYFEKYPPHLSPCGRGRHAKHGG
jgi:riboflavin kinase/FMN adenylyltransferase